jgi:hypothetical protein
MHEDRVVELRHYTLRPALAGSGFDLDGAVRPARGSAAIRQQLIVSTIYTLGASAAATFPVEFARVIAPVLTASGAAPVALLETEPSANDFPRLPVREGEHAFVWLVRFPDAAGYDRHLETLERSREWRESVTPLLDRSLEVPAEVWRLVPAARSHTLH